MKNTMMQPQGPCLTLHPADILYTNEEKKPNSATESISSREE